MNTAPDYATLYEPEHDFDRWYTLLTAQRLAPQIAPHTRILELGAATGLLTQSLAAPARTITAVERAAPYVASGRAKSLPGVTWYHTDIAAFDDPIPYDHILACNVLHELPDPAALLRRLPRWLTHHGLIHVTLPNPNSLHRLAAHAAGLIDAPGALSARGQRFHTRHMWTADQAIALFAAHGMALRTHQAILIKPLPNAAMEQLSDAFITAWDALSPALPEHGAMNYLVFSHG